jgi:hypothetical protein
MQKHNLDISKLFTLVGVADILYLNILEKWQLLKLEQLQTLCEQ